MGRWSTFLKPARKLHVGDTIVIADDFSAEVVYKNGGEVHLDFNEKSEEFFAKIERYGVMPLPPYIAKKRAPDKSDNENYQTIFAQRPGAVAAPTAGLHFSQELVAAITAKNASIDYVTLHVGGGTFLPIKVENTDDHIMHSEYGEISKSVADRINATKKNGGRIIAIGTTSLRILESCVNDKGQVFSYAGETDIFITPGYEFKVADCMMTNFHLPQSTLFMLICAFSGTKTMKQAYAHAIEKEYRFYSYGDACFLENGVKD
jgi:S-adenosylmethionine:tRNA ribosyltransferase-isomerase